MNKIYFIFWNASLGRYTIASEHAKSNALILTKATKATKVVSTAAFLSMFGILNLVNASVSISDGGVIFAGHNESSGGSNLASKVAGAFALHDAIVGDGDDVQANANNSIALGADFIATRANTISVGDAGAERQITNIVKGTHDTDAITIGQSKSSVGLLGSDAMIKEDASISAPNYTVQGGRQFTVSGALDALNIGANKNILVISENKTAIRENKALTDQKIADNKSSSDIAIQSNTSLINNNKLETDAIIFANKVTAENTNIAINAKVTANTNLINKNKGLSDVTISKNTVAISENKTATISENKALTDQKIADNKTSFDITIQSNTSLINNNKLETDATIFANKVTAENTNIAINAKVTANTDLINTNKGLSDAAISKNTLAISENKTATISENKALTD